jgi:hypothetical protein
MISKAIFRTALLLGLSAGASWAFCAADVLTFKATMTGSQETPPNASTATGSATVTLNGNLLTVNESFSGLSAVATGAHIHCCAAPGASAPVVVPFPFPPFPAATSGTFSDTFDLSTFSFTGGATEASFIAGLESGLAYVNIHNVNFPAGEIRGQLVQVAATPEPGTLLLLGTGIAGIAGTLRRRAAIQRS